MSGSRMVPDVNSFGEELRVPDHTPAQLIDRTQVEGQKLSRNATWNWRAVPRPIWFETVEFNIPKPPPADAVLKGWPGWMLGAVELALVGIPCASRTVPGLAKLG